MDSPFWPLIVLVIVWIIFLCLCFWLYKPGSGLQIVDLTKSEDSLRLNKGSLLIIVINYHQLNVLFSLLAAELITYVIRIRFHPKVHTFSEDNSSKIVLKFYCFKEKVATVSIPLKTLADNALEFVDYDHYKEAYFSVVFDYLTSDRFTRCDELRIGFVSDEDSSITIKDVDIRQAEFNLKSHFSVNYLFKSFPFLVDDKSYNAILLDNTQSENFRCNSELLNRGDMLLILFLQFNISYVIINLNAIPIRVGDHGFIVVFLLTIVTGLAASVMSLLLIVPSTTAIIIYKQLQSPLRFKPNRKCNKFYIMPIIIFSAAAAVLSGIIHMKSNYQIMFKLMASLVSSLFNTIIILIMYAFYNCHFNTEKKKCQTWKKNFYLIIGQ